MFARLIPYVLLLVLAAGLAVGGYYAGVQVGRAEEQAKQLAADIKQAGIDADKAAEYDDELQKIAKEDAKADDDNAIQERKIDAAARLESSGVACGGPVWLRELERLK